MIYFCFFTIVQSHQFFLSFAILRFDFQGRLLKGTAESGSIPTHFGLHHHGDEPDAPGYNMQELFILSRSNFMKQRVLAVSMLGKIIVIVRKLSFFLFFLLYYFKSIGGSCL